MHFPESTSRLQKNQFNDGCKHFPYKTKNLNENFQNENHTNVSGAATINKETQSELVIRGRSKEGSKQNQQVLQTNQFTTSKENKTSCSTQTSKTTTPTLSTSATTTPDLTTQKCKAPINYELNNSNTDAEQTTMREWLNPLTQSEIEYEKKKQKEGTKKSKAQQEKFGKKSKYDSGRIQQLNWIENEIKRLECLKHLLLKDETYGKSSTSVSSLEHTAHEEVNITKDSTQTDKLYDTVYSDKSSVLSESAERLVQEIEIILEESHEDVINVKDNIKRNKERKKETKILYETGTKTKPKTIFRTINENINFHEEQLLNGKESKNSNRQREKMDTPSTIKSVESESLRDLVQQRKREFMEAYKTKKQNHYEALKKQQKKDLKCLNTQRKINEKIATTRDSQHYSVPHTLPRKYVSNEVSYAYTQHPLPLTPTEKEVQLKPHHDQREHIIYSTTAEDQKETVKPFGQENINATAVNTNNTLTTASSSSMFCMSSEVSVPMGSQNVSSTPTTTHQYDDVAVAAGINGVAVQTSDSIMRSKPIYGPKHSLTTLITYADTASSTTACIQVKPKGIAYVIEFDDNKHATSNSTSSTDINSNNMHLKSCAKSDNFLNTNITNNMQPLLPTEPQLTLQEHLEKSNPKFLQHSKERKAILNQLQSMRQERDRQLREIIENTSFKSLDRRLKYLPPPPIRKF